MTIPVLCAGKAEAVGKGIIEGLKPEVEVIHFTLASNIDNEIPLLLQNKTPPSPSSTLGSGNWSTPPVALLLGGAFDDEAAERLRKLVYEGPEGDKARRIPWVRVDGSLPAPDPVKEPKVYGGVVIERLKKGLVGLEGEGKLKEGEEGVFLF